MTVIVHRVKSVSDEVFEHSLGEKSPFWTRTITATDEAGSEVVLRLFADTPDALKTKTTQTQAQSEGSF